MERNERKKKAASNARRRSFVHIYVVSLPALRARVCVCVCVLSFVDGIKHLLFCCFRFMAAKKIFFKKRPHEFL
jgi:hypothetical protein